MLKFKFLKRVLMVSCLSIHLAYSAEELPDLRRLQGEIQISSQRVRTFREAHGDTNSVIVIGMTGHGKSTLITHLAGMPLVARTSAAGPLALDTEVPLPDFHIGEGSAVGTKIPSSWYDPASGVVYWDCPGFGDPRGAEADIVNAFSIRQLFQEPSRSKIVITVKESDILDRAKSFGGLLKQVIETFPDSRQLEDCLSLVVTRHERVNVLGALGMLYAGAEENALFRIPRVKSLVKFLSDNAATRVSCMPYAAAVGPYVGNRASILASIASSDYVMNPLFNISVPAESGLLVRQLSRQMNAGIAGYIAGTFSSLVEAQLLNIIRRHAETAAAMKARFTVFGEMLGRVRNDNPRNYIQDLQAFLRALEVLDPLDNLTRDEGIIAFFSGIVREPLHETILWKNALENIIGRIGDASRAPTSRVNPVHSGHREDDGTWRVVRCFGRNQQDWQLNVVRDVSEQDSTLFPGISEPILDPHTLSFTEHYETREGERGGSKWRNGYRVVWTR